MTKIPDTDTCEICEYCYIPDSSSGQIFCRRFPPTVFQTPIFNQISNRHELTLSAALVPIQSGQWCGEFSIKLSEIK